jgi:hypothetical protein
MADAGAAKAAGRRVTIIQEQKDAEYASFLLFANNLVACLLDLRRLQVIRQIPHAQLHLRHASPHIVKKIRHLFAGVGRGHCRTLPCITAATCASGNVLPLFTQGVVRFVAGIFSAGAAGPSPLPSTAWQDTQYELNKLLRKKDQRLPSHRTSDQSEYLPDAGIGNELTPVTC